MRLLKISAGLALWKKWRGIVGIGCLLSNDIWTFFINGSWDQIGTKTHQIPSVPKITIETIEMRKGLILQGMLRNMLYWAELRKTHFSFPSLSGLFFDYYLNDNYQNIELKQTFAWGIAREMLESIVKQTWAFSDRPALGK